MPIHFISLLDWNRRDQHHDRVVAFSRNFRARLLTTDWIVMEVADALATSRARAQVRDLVLHLRESPDCEIIAATRELFDRGLDLYQERSDKDWTLTDCTSFVVMRERGLTSALTADHHFEQAGFTALLR